MSWFRVWWVHLSFFLSWGRGDGCFWRVHFFTLFTGNLLPTFVTLSLVWALFGHLFRCHRRYCGGSCGSGWLFPLRAELCNMAKLFATPTARPSALNHYHHLPTPTCDNFRNSLKFLPRQAQPEHVFTVFSPGGRSQ